MSATATVTSLTGGSGEFPLFTDGSAPYTGVITGTGSERVGLAARIAVNPAVVADPSSLIAYQAGTPAGDSTRPDFILQQLTNASLTFSPNTGIGTVSAPFSGSLTTYLRQVISQQGEAAELGQQSQAGPGRCSQLVAAPVQRCVGCQCRSGNGEPAFVAKFLRRQRARHVGGEGYA